jgi:hypothetical protein
LGKVARTGAGGCPRASWGISLPDVSKDDQKRFLSLVKYINVPPWKQIGPNRVSRVIDIN